MTSKNPEFLAKLQKRTLEYSISLNGHWLQEFEWTKVPVEFSLAMPENVMGMYNFGKIILRDTFEVEDYIWPTYVHELRHRWQWKRHPIRYLIGKIFFLRFIIENDAYAEEDKAEAWMMTNN